MNAKDGPGVPLRKPCPSQVDVSVILASEVYLDSPHALPGQPPPITAQHSRGEEPEGVEVRVGLEEHIWQVFVNGEKISL